MKQHRSRVDFLFALMMLVGVFLVDLAAMGTSMVFHLAAPQAIFMGLIGVLTLPALVLLFLLPMRYTLTSDELVMRSGLLRWHIPLSAIMTAKTTRSLRPAPALSYQRLRVDYQKGNRSRSIDLSPRDRNRFLSDLVSIDRGLVWQADGLVRQAGQILPLQNLAR